MIKDNEQMNELNTEPVTDVQEKENVEQENQEEKEVPGEEQQQPKQTKHMQKVESKISSAFFEVQPTFLDTRAHSSETPQQLIF